MKEWSAIGIVHNGFNESTPPELIRALPSRISVFPEYQDGLYRIDVCNYVDIVFSLHKVTETRLTAKVRSGDIRGIFASRSPYRPNHIGVTTVRLLSVDNNELLVEGLDALNESPVLDIKCSDTSLFEQSPVYHSRPDMLPNLSVIRLIREKDTKELLRKTAEFHGSYPEDLAWAVATATEAMYRIFNLEIIPSEVRVKLYAKGVWADALQVISGCTFGNGRLTQVNSDSPNLLFSINDLLFVSKKTYPAKESPLIPDTLSAAEKAFLRVQENPESLFSFECRP